MQISSVCHPCYEIEHLFLKTKTTTPATSTTTMPTTTATATTTTITLIRRSSKSRQHEHNAAAAAARVLPRSWFPHKAAYLVSLGPLLNDHGQPCVEAVAVGQPFPELLGAVHSACVGGHHHCKRRLVIDRSIQQEGKERKTRHDEKKTSQ